MTSVDAHLRLVHRVRELTDPRGDGPATTGGVQATIAAERLRQAASRSVNTIGLVPEEPATVGEVQVAIAAERLREVVTAVDDADALIRRPQVDAHVRAWRDLERAMAEWRPGDDPPWPGARGMDLSRLRAAIGLMLPPDEDAIAEAEAIVHPTAWIDDLPLPDRPPIDAPLWRLLVYPVQRWWWSRWIVRNAKARREWRRMAKTHREAQAALPPAERRAPASESVRQARVIAERAIAETSDAFGRQMRRELEGWQRDGEPWTCESWPVPSVAPPESGWRND